MSVGQNTKRKKFKNVLLHKVLKLLNEKNSTMEKA